MKKKLNELLAEHSGKSLEEIERDTDRDNFMSSDEAVNYGLIDSVSVNRFDIKKDK